MNIAPVIFFGISAAILVMALALVAIVLYLSRLTKTLRPGTNPKSDTGLPDETGIKAAKIIDDANNKALDIITRATLSTNVTSENFKQEILNASSAQIKEFEKTTADFTAAYFKVLQDLKTKNIEVFQNVSKDIEENTMEEIKNFKESMEKLTTLSQKEVKEKVDADYAASKKEIEEYKQAELGKIDSGIYELLEKISKLVLGKALSLSEHEDLIEKSLEKAKKEGVFK